MAELQRFEGPRLPEVLASTIEKVLIQGDLAKLDANERLSYYSSLCRSLSLNPLTKPFEYIQLNGKLQLYALKSCTEQLRQIHSLSITIVSRECVEGCYVVCARASMPSGRQDESIGAVGIENLKGEVRSNAMMKAETKAKRRVTLSICGLAYLDESEMESVRGASHVPVDMATGVIPDPAPAATLHEDIDQHPARETAASAKSTTPFNALKAFADLKKRFKAIGKEDVYYTILSKWGVEKSSQFPATIEGMKSARGCYKELSLVVADLEVPVKAVDTLPDPVLDILGKRLRCKDVVYELVEASDAPSGRAWQEVGK